MQAIHDECIILYDTHDWCQAKIKPWYFTKPMQDWLRDTPGHGYYYRMNFDPQLTPRFSFWFRNQDDAVLFDLTWG